MDLIDFLENGLTLIVHVFDLLGLFNPLIPVLSCSFKTVKSLLSIDNQIVVVEESDRISY
jgi:hypothetical protein